MSKHHGKPGGYTNHGCRQDCCKKAWAEYTKLRRQTQRAALVVA